jgi:hypothetical protein
VQVYFGEPKNPALQVKPVAVIVLEETTVASLALTLDGTLQVITFAMQGVPPAV